MAKETQFQKPIYQLIALDMAESIAGGHYQPGEKIHGRSTLASKYNVSPETVRRAMFLLKDMDILEMKQGSGIFIKRVDKAQNFVEKFKNAFAADELKENINALTRERHELDDQLNEAVMALLDSYQRFAYLSPLTPFELHIRE
ncbi:MAG: GntR family transcriptional regulator, partial [Pygmaiobacter sp.]